MRIGTEAPENKLGQIGGRRGRRLCRGRSHQAAITKLSRSSRGRGRCRGRSHQIAITKLPSLSRSSRGRSRCRGRSHQTAITKLAAAIVVVAVGVV